MTIHYRVYDVVNPENTFLLIVRHNWSWLKIVLGDYEYWILSYIIHIFRGVLHDIIVPQSFILVHFISMWKACSLRVLLTSLKTLPLKENVSHSICASICLNRIISWDWLDRISIGRMISFCLRKLKPSCFGIVLTQLWLSSKILKISCSSLVPSRCQYICFGTKLIMVPENIGP